MYTCEYVRTYMCQVCILVRQVQFGRYSMYVCMYLIVLSSLCTYIDTAVFLYGICKALSALATYIRTYVIT